jgi:signal transduction histidine kinase/CheY-like chemotaxis protein
MDGLNTGRKLPDNLDGIIQASSGSTAPQLYPYVQLTDDLFADVHVLNTGEETQLILQDVSDGHGDEYKLQQKAHEVSLLLEQQAELNRELAEKRQEAERASQAKSRFIASMSHEFRSPITSIMGHAEMLKTALPGSARTAAIQRASWHLLTLVENLLEQARTGEGIVHINIVPVDIAAVIDDMKEMFTVQAQSRDLEFNVHAESGVPVVFSDELRLRQVLINLISNAIRYTDKGSIELACSFDDQAVHFSIRDTGKGIAAEDIERIFDAFTRLGDDGGGAGLGLTISQQLVSALGSELTVESKPGEGSVFKFSLPYRTVADAAIEGDLNGVSILLVEDDDDLREMYRIFMEDWGMDVTAVPGFAHAISAFDDNKTDVLMTDFNLSDGKGTALISELRKLSPTTVSILCSGSGCTENGLPFEPASADALIVKPIVAEHLKSVILSTLNTE